MPKSFRDLKVWHLSIDLTTLVYRMTEAFPKHELFGEGSARATRKDFRQFVIIARGSCSELQTQLIIAKRLRYGEPACVDAAERLSHEVGRMLNGLSRFLKKASVERPNTKN